MTWKKGEYIEVCGTPRAGDAWHGQTRVFRWLIPDPAAPVAAMCAQDLAVGVGW